jgi:hypothetical protein
MANIQTGLGIPGVGKIFESSIRVSASETTGFHQQNRIIYDSSELNKGISVCIKELHWRKSFRTAISLSSG